MRVRRTFEIPLIREIEMIKSTFVRTYEPMSLNQLVVTRFCVHRAAYRIGFRVPMAAKEASRHLTWAAPLIPPAAAMKHEGRVEIAPTNALAFLKRKNVASQSKRSERSGILA